MIEFNSDVWGEPIANTLNQRFGLGTQSRKPTGAEPVVETPYAPFSTLGGSNPQEFLRQQNKSADPGFNDPRLGGGFEDKRLGSNDAFKDLGESATYAEHLKNKDRSTARDRDRAQIGGPVRSQALQDRENPGIPKTGLEQYKTGIEQEVTSIPGLKNNFSYIGNR